MASEDLLQLPHPLKLATGLQLGGGRGVIAAVDITPGQLLLVERPLVTVPADKEDQELLHIAVTRAALQQQPPEARVRTLSAAALLHPLSLAPEHLPPEVLEAVREQHKEDVQRLMACQAEPVLDADEVLRLLLAVRFNAFYSGMYLKCEMFNHACDPNAIKLATADGASEVRALRPIAAGEEVTISYLNPPLQSHARRLHQLREQHFFAPSGSSQYPPQAEEFAPQEEATFDAQAAQQQMTSLEDQLDAWEPETAAAIASGSLPRLALSLCRLLAARRAAAALLHPRHLVLARIHDALVQLCHAVLALAEEAPAAAPITQLLPDPAALAAPAGGDAGTGSSGSSGALQVGVDFSFGPCSTAAAPAPAATAAAAPAAAPVAAVAASQAAPPSPSEVAVLLLKSCCELRATQDLLYGPTSCHYDVARSLLDQAQALAFLLANAPKALQAAFPVEYGTFAKASRAEYAARKRHEQIRAMYSKGDSKGGAVKGPVAGANGPARRR